MVRVILGGRKTQTRRVIKARNVFRCYLADKWHVNKNPISGWQVFPYPNIPQEELDRLNQSAIRNNLPGFKCPYGQSGDRLWVKEAWKFSLGKNGAEIFYKTYPVGQGGGFIPGPWKFSILMPRWASRITLEITDVRVERLQDISENDAEAEGAHGYTNTASPIDFFICLWDSLNAKRNFGWDINPWVWVISFKRIEKRRDI